MLAIPSPGIYWVPSMFKPIMLKKGLVSVFSCVFLALFFLGPASSCLGQLLVSCSWIFYLKVKFMNLGQKGKNRKKTTETEFCCCRSNTCSLFLWFTCQAVSQRLIVRKNTEATILTPVSFCPAPSHMVSTSRLWLNLKTMSRFMQHFITELEVSLLNWYSILLRQQDAK